MTTPSPRAVLDFWLRDTPSDKWFATDPALDAEIRSRFEAVWRAGCAGELDDWEDEPNGALALIILFDQFPRNMFAGQADQFATDHLALAIAKGAIAEDFDKQLEAKERGFLYMPFQHSENLADQNQSMLLFTELGDANQLSYAKKHHDIVARFGRFPHRNAILGRAPRADEIAAGDITPF